MAQRLLLLAIAGACGTVSRYILCDFASRTRFAHLSIGTFTVNILGSLLFGFIYAVARKKFNMNMEMQVILLTGFLGAFTTFSAFAFDTAQMLKSSQWLMACGNIMGQIILGIAALGAGVLIGRTI
jgi:fluoride exporter